MNLDKDIVEQLAKDNHILAHPVHKGATWYEVQHIDHLLAFAKAVIEHVQSDEPLAINVSASIYTKPYKQLIEALQYWRNECSGQEPSISVFERMVDEALASQPTVTAHKE